MPDERLSIQERQNDPSMITLLRATSVSHARVRRLNALRLSVGCAFAALGLIVTLTGGAVAWIAILGVLWGLTYAAGVSSWADDELRRATKLQEMFDVRLFRIPWNSVVAGEELPAYEVSRLNRHYHGDAENLRNYYEIPDLPRPFDVLGCQQQNLGWGARVRRRYANTILGGVVVWAAAGLFVGALTSLSLTGLVLRWYVPSLGILLLGLDEFRGQRGIASGREHVLSLVRARIAQVTEAPRKAGEQSDLMILARQVQDSIFHTRTRQPRVPNWFFSRFQTKDRLDFQEAMRELVRTLDYK